MKGLIAFAIQTELDRSSFSDFVAGALYLNISFLVFIQPLHSDSLHRYLPTTRLCIRITLVLPTLPSTRSADMAYLSSIAVQSSPHFARRPCSFSAGVHRSPRFLHAVSRWAGLLPRCASCWDTLEVTTAVDRFMGEEAGFGRPVQEFWTPPYCSSPTAPVTSNPRPCYCTLGCVPGFSESNPRPCARITV